MNDYGFTPQVIDDAERAMKLHTAFTEGQRAGQLQIPRGHNPFLSGTLEHAEWERGRSATHQEAA